MYAEIYKDLCTDRVVTGILREAELQVRLDRVKSLILQLVRADLVDKSDSTAFLTQVEKHASALLGNLLHCCIILLSAVAACRTKCIAGQTLGMYTAKNWFAIGDVTLYECDMVLAV